MYIVKALAHVIQVVNCRYLIEPDLQLYVYSEKTVK